MHPREEQNEDLEFNTNHEEIEEVKDYPQTRKDSGSLMLDSTRRFRHLGAGSKPHGKKGESPGFARKISTEQPYFEDTIQPVHANSFEEYDHAPEL